MAISATIYKASVAIADMTRQHYHTYPLTIALHPSETVERMMVRILAFALNADQQLEFTKGISTDDEPDLWQKDLTGHTEHWIELGQPDEIRLRKACAQADKVTVINFQQRASDIWWQQNHNKLTRFDNLTVTVFDSQACQQLEELTERSMQLQLTIEDDAIWLSTNQGSIEIPYFTR